MADTPKVVAIGSKDELAGSVENLRRNLPMLIEHGQLIAQMKRAYFLALCKEGFSEREALELCKASALL